MNLYKLKDNRIKIICHKKNMGLSDTRNTGLKYTTSPYVTFVDSDDIIMPTFIETLASDIENNDFTEVGITAFQQTDNNEKIFYNFVNRNRYFHKFENMDKQYPVNPATFVKIHMTVWNKLFKMEIIKKYNIKFPSKLLFEDNHFTYTYISHANNFKFTNKLLYLYRRNNNKSLTHKIDTNKYLYDSVITVYLKIIEHLKQYNLFNKYKKALKILFQKIYLHDIQVNKHSKKLLKLLDINYTKNDTIPNIKIKIRATDNKLKLKYCIQRFLRKHIKYQTSEINMIRFDNIQDTLNEYYKNNQIEIVEELQNLTFYVKPEKSGNLSIQISPYQLHSSFKTKYLKINEIKINENILIYNYKNKVTYKNNLFTGFKAEKNKLYKIQIKYTTHFFPIPYIK